MSFYNQRSSYTGSIAKKPRLAPRGPHLISGNVRNEDGDCKRLKSFKEFILSESNDINEQEGLQRYIEYKTEFTKKQIADFFKTHQEEEWFRNKYRPVEIKKFEEANQESKNKRKKVFQELTESKLVGDIIIDYQHHEELLQFLDYCSLLLEGATLEEVESGEAHKTKGVSSIFIPFLHPSVDKSMIEEHASKQDGFLRVAMSEALADRGFCRRAWITYSYKDHDDLKKLCWENNAHKFNGRETKSIINRQTNSRIMYTDFWFCHTKASKADLKNVAKLLTFFEGEDCPLLETIKDHLIEETNEEEQALGLSEEEEPAFSFNQDTELLKALDKVILYLRVVHSYDYYSASEYTGEDEMPHKLGLMHARPIPPSTYGDNPMEKLMEFIEAQKARINAFLEKPTLSEIEQKQLGKKDIDEEVSNFIFQHTQEKKPGEKYICRLTKKRFTSAEFVRKHIFNRCGDKVEEVKTEAHFFNNYVSDPNRPM